MNTKKVLRLFAAFFAVALLASACNGDDAEDRPTVTIGSVNFDENVIVANMYAGVLEEAGYTVNRRFMLGARDAVMPAAEGGEIDLFPEYIGSATEHFEPGTATGDTDETAAALRGLLDERGLELLEPAPAENKNGLVVTRETADQHGLTATSDLQPVAGELVLGGPPECPERPLCLIGFTETYGLEFADFQPLDAGGPITVQALRDGDIDVALLFTTDESIVEFGWVLLDDDQDLQPAENIAPVIRSEVVTDELRDLLNGLSAQLTTEEITELNRRVRLEGEDPQDVAEGWLRDQGLID
jgi:osmoprotectant transport system substrate-binding protein